jgi:YgiT-type zinc finger domain-containing protein
MDGLQVQEIMMFLCAVCHATESHQAFVTDVFQIHDKPVMVEQIPATVCVRCGEETFSRETMEKIRRMVHREGQPHKSVAMDVFTFA